MEMYYMSRGIDNYIEVNGCEIMLQLSSPHNYRLKMLENNDIEGLIRPICMEIDGRLTLKYNTNACYVLDRLFVKVKPDGNFLKIIMKQLESVLYKLKEFLMEPDDVVLKPEYMFYNWGEKTLRLIYIPGYGVNIKKQLKGFLEYVMKIFDHRDEEGVRYMYGMYDLICDDTFSIEDFKLEFKDNGGQQECLPMQDKVTDLNVAERNMYIEEKNLCTEPVYKEITKLVPLTSGALKEIIISKYDEMILVGRGKKETDYRIPTTQISRVHACIYLRSNGIYVEDRESTNGTFVNSVRLEPLKQEQIRIGDMICFANEEFFAV